MMAITTSSSTRVKPELIPRARFITMLQERIRKKEVPPHEGTFRSRKFAPIYRLRPRGPSEIVPSQAKSASGTEKSPEENANKKRLTPLLPVSLTGRIRGCKFPWFFLDLGTTF